MPDPRKIDPTVPYTIIEIGGTTYKLACTHRGIALAEEELLRRGRSDVNLLVAKLRPSVGGTRVLFAASLLHYQPETDFEAAQDLVNDENLVEVLNALDASRAKSFPEPTEETHADPQQPAQQ